MDDLYSHLHKGRWPLEAPRRVEPAPPQEDEPEPEAAQTRKDLWERLADLNSLIEAGEAEKSDVSEARRERDAVARKLGYK